MSFFKEILTLFEEEKSFKEDIEPFVQDLKYFVDDRGYSLMNILAGNLNGGQINVSSMHPKVVKAWHRHKVQIDFWIPIRGTLKCAVYNAKRNKFWSWVLGEMNPSILVIPSNCWHGCCNIGDDTATLLYYVSQVYNSEDPDEERKGPNAHEMECWVDPKKFSWNTKNK